MGTTKTDLENKLQAQDNFINYTMKIIRDSNLSPNLLELIENNLKQINQEFNKGKENEIK